MSQTVTTPTENGFDDRDLQDRLRALRTPPPDSDRDFAASLHRRLVAAGPPLPVGLLDGLRERWQRHRAIAWPLAGIATGVATFVLLMATRAEVPGHATPAMVAAAQPVAPTPPAVDPRALTRSGSVAPTYAVPADKVAVIHLNFAAEVSVEDVTFEVALPDGLVFWSKGEALAERTFRWPGSLTVGENVMPIAVRGNRAGLFRVTARAEVEGSILEHDVWLRVQKGA